MKPATTCWEAQAPSVKLYASDGIIERLASAETWVQQTWNGDAARARAADPDIAFIFPKEGAVVWMRPGHPDRRRGPGERLFLHFMLRP